MVSRIDQDYQRFRQIVKGKIREDLRKFISRGELLGKEGKRLISIPVHGIDTPRFRYGPNDNGGVGSGEGKPGDQVDTSGEGVGPGGTEPGRHIMEVDISLEELADILGEELELPRIQPKGKKNISSMRDRYTGISVVGPESLRHFKRTFREAIKRQIISGTYDPTDPRVVPIRNDKRYRSWKTVLLPESNALIIYMMDVSGSMGPEQKELVRLEAFWIDTWLRRNYKGIESRYIVHDVNAHEVDRETFFHVREDGGTRISSAFGKASELIHTRYDPLQWNLYLFHFSDGDNSSDQDSRECIRILNEDLLEHCNMFGYCQVASAYGSGNFYKVIDDNLAEHEKVIATKVNNKDEILDSIRSFFKAGK